MKFHYKHEVTVAGHRGDPAHYPENTMRSFESAIEKGADMIETDIHVSKDGVLVLIHDATVDRTTDGAGKVIDKTYAQLRQLNAGTLDDFQHIPTLDEFLKLASKLDIFINLEIKEYYNGSNAEFCQQVIDKVIDLVEKYDLGSKCVFTSFDAFALEYLYKQYNNKYRLHGFYPYDIMKNEALNPAEYLYSAYVFDHGNINNSLYLKEN